MGGMDMTLDGDVLLAKATEGTKQWVAKITGPHPEYGMDREFIAYQKPKTTERARGTAHVSDGDIIERVTFSHSGDEESREYFTVIKDAEVAELEPLDRDKLEIRLERMGNSGGNGDGDDT